MASDLGVWVELQISGHQERGKELFQEAPQGLNVAAPVVPKCGLPRALWFACS